MPVKLSELLEVLEHPDEWHAYLNPDSGEIEVVTDDDSMYVDDEEADRSALPEWQRSAIVKNRAALNAGNLIPLPGKFELHEWAIMRRFADAQPEAERAELLDALHGTGAFRHFRSSTERLGLRDDWFGWRDDAVREFARTWLRDKGVQFEED